jgi:small subunit ribosomal protein S1
VMFTSDTGQESENPIQSPEQLENLDQLYADSFRNLQEGSVVNGTIVAICSDGIIVDIGYKSEGIIPRAEFSGDELRSLKVGEKLQVYLEEREDNEGNIILSKEKADRMKIWGDLERIQQRKEIIEGKVLTKIKGGMIVDIGIKAFLPGSQIDLRPVRDLDQLVGKTIPVKVIKMNHRRSNVVVSRRAVLEESRDKKKLTALATLQEGQVIQGMVKNITDYGAFIDLGGIDGLLHITDMSWGRVNHPSEILMVGDKIGVVILKYDRESGRVSLGLKQKTPDPWGQVEEKYQVSSRVSGKVVSITDYGAFVELEPGIEGLVHISEMSWSHDVKHPSKLVSVGSMIEAVILNVDKKGRKISLGMKQIEQNPWDVVEKKYTVGARIDGKVKNITDFGLFVGLEEGIDGLIHISDISWTKRISHPSEMFKKGQSIEAVVLKIDREKERISLGYKQLTPDPWEHGLPEKYKAGQDVQGKVVRVTDFGVFVELEEGVEGLVHVSEMDLDPSAKLEEMFNVEDPVTATITRVDTTERKISLSIRKDAKALTAQSDEPEEDSGDVAGKAEKTPKK